MAKGKDNTKTILIIAGIAGGLYLLTRPSVQEKVQEIVGGGGFPSIQSLQFTMPDLAGFMDQLSEVAGGTCFPGGLLPDFNIPGAGFGDLLGGLDDIVSKITGGGGSATGPVEHATWADVAYNLPSWAAGAIGVGATAVGGYGGYHLIRATAPILKAIGTQSARGIGGAGTILKNLLTRSVVPKVGGQVIKSVPVATGARVGGMLGILPALALAGIVEGAYQIFRTIKGESNIGTTGVIPIDIVNLIRGKFRPWSIEPIPTLLLPQFGTAEASEQPPALGGSPATIMPTFTQPQLGAGKTTPLATQLPELKFPSSTAAPAAEGVIAKWTIGPVPAVPAKSPYEMYPEYQ